jgi:hypothetical protein
MIKKIACPVGQLSRNPNAYRQLTMFKPTVTIKFE